ncbi:MAG: hypothetical protein V3S49_05150 [Thermodesulfobacteriota bacterium]
MDHWMKERTWFLKMVHEGDAFSTESMKQTERYDEIQKKLNQDNKSCSTLSYIFLARAPLTFGHSQLVMKFLSVKQQNEADFFEMVAPTIKGAISVFEKVLGSDCLHKSPEFTKLAELTRTDESYLKTLVLRASADECPKGEYKVHLVPYFESHAEKCQERYRGIHHINSGTGGLLGWLGKRETEVDRWQISSETPWAVKLDEIANIDLNMKEFARLLAKA